MNYSSILDAAETGVYAALAFCAIYGIFCVVLLVRRIAQKRFGDSQASREFLEEISTHLSKRSFDEVARLCDTPPYWSQAVPQLMSLAIASRRQRPAQLRRTVAEAFEREVLADLEYRSSWINTLVKSAPMLGLLGTVLGMINAFKEIGLSQQVGNDPTVLANNISFALTTTALGLTIAIPLVLAGAMINVRIGRLQDSVQFVMTRFLDELDDARAKEGA